MPSYTSLEAQLHDLFWADEETPEFEWLDVLLKEHPGLALEIGSGSGRLLLPLLAKGHTIEGLEPSREMLDLCRDSADKQNLAPILYEGDMSTFAPGKTYHCLLVPAFTLQLSADPAATLAHFEKLLVPGGLLYLTVFIPFAEIHEELPENEWYPDHEIELPDGRTASIHTRHQIDRTEQILTRKHHYRLHDGDDIEEHKSDQTVRWFTARQLSELLTETGFIVESAVADFDDELPVDDESQIITVIARKGGGTPSCH